VGPLSGVRVLEVSHWVAVPFAGANLADLGADVVKVEPPGGEPMRHTGAFVPTESKVFHAMNRGKRGIVLDLQRPEAQTLVYHMIPSFDVFMINSRPGVPRRLGLDYAKLTAYSPDLIYMDSTAYGSQGPSANRAGSDAVVQAYSGLMAAEAKVNPLGAPEGIRSTALIDYTTGFAAAMAVCAALYRRAVTGEGEFIETSLLNTALAIQTHSVSRLPVSDELLVRPLLSRIAAARDAGEGYAGMAAARREVITVAGSSFLLYYGAYRVKDGAIILGALSPANRDACRRAIGIADDPSDAADFNALDAQNQELVEALADRIRKLMLTRTMDEWIERLDREGAPASKVNMPEDMAVDPQVTAMGYMRHYEHSLTGPEELVGPAVRMRTSSTGASLPSPALGQHTDEVLSECGISREEIVALRAVGAIA
jgi:formyl-CoA transferase